MSDVFISYARSTEREAKQIAEALRGLGYGVWRDDELPAHRVYGDVIEERLKAAKAVVVLWSADAVKSQWVRAEADFARSEAKLVQATLDGAVPPMPFNQIQCAQLRGRRDEADDIEWRKIAEAVADLVGGAVRPRQDSPLRARTLRRPPWIAVAGAILILVVAAVGGVWIATHTAAPATSTARVAILPFRVQGADPALHSFADSLTDGLQSTLTDNQTQVVSREDAEALTGADRDRQIEQLGVRLIFEGSVEQNGAAIDTTVSLDDARSHVAVWSGRFSGPADQPDALRANVGASVVAVLNCAALALQPTHGLNDPQVLALYLHACDAFERNELALNPEDAYQVLDTLKQVTLRAPQFAPAFSARAKFAAYLAPTFPPDKAAAIVAEARAEADHALAADPHDGDSYVALYMLLPHDDWQGQEAVLRRGLAANPDWPYTNGFLGSVLLDVGRVQEGADYLQKAAAANPLSLDFAAESAEAAAEAGRTQAADAASAVLTRSWPGNPEAVWSRMSILSIEGRWAEAGASSNGLGPFFSAAGVAANRSFFAAKTAPSPKAVATARAAQLQWASEPGAPLMAPISNLAGLGMVDDAFAVAEKYRPGPLVTGGSPSFLFSSATQAMRRDPRFMALAARLGFVDYWRTSGHWPDFCAEPGLPYDCKAEAAKLAGAHS